MTPERWGVGLVVFIVLCFLGTCWALWRRENTDAKKAARENTARKLADIAAQSKPVPPQLIGRNGRTQRIVPLGRKAGR